MRSGETLDLIVPERYRERHWAGFRAAIARGAPLHEGAAALIPVRCAGGREAHFPGRFVFVRDAFERTAGVMAVFAPPDDPALAGRPLDRLD